MNKIDNLLWQAKMQKDKNWLKARNLLNDALEEEPTNIDILRTIAELYHSKKLFHKAIVYYQMIIAQNEEDEQAIFRAANCFLLLNEFKIAIDYYDKIKLPFPELLYNKAFAYSKLKNNDKSIEILKELLKYIVSSEIPYIFIAELYFTKKKFNEAIFYLNKAESSFGKRGTIFYLRGLANFQLHHWLKAYVEFQSAEKMKVRTPHFYRTYGITCEMIGKTTRAVDLLLKCIKLLPFDPAGYIELINLYINHNRTMEAYSIVKLAKKNLPTSITITMLYNKILENLRKER